MKATCAAIVVGYVILLSGSLAQAQNAGFAPNANQLGSAPGDVGILPLPSYQRDDQWYQPHPIYHHASTAEEGALRGWADYWRGVADLQYRLSIARINNEAARTHYLDNVRKGLQTWWERPSLRRQALASSAAPRPTPEQIAKFARDRAPTPLADSQYDDTLGTLYWPPELQRGLFADERTRIDLLLAERAARPQDSGLGTDNYVRIRETTEEMKEKLKGNVGAFTPMEYIAAKRFLTGVEFEAQRRATSRERRELLSMQ